MELPVTLRQAVDRLLEGTPLAELQKAAGLLSSRYRTEIRDGRLHLDDRLVTLSYVLDEIAPAAIGRLVERLWAFTSGVLLIAEPGTPAGWQRILATREQLVAAGAHVLAPCPHAVPCTLAAPEWCHFARRVARSRLHRLAKRGNVPWEDEKYVFLAASRQPGKRTAARVLAPPRVAKGMVSLKLCGGDGTACERTVTKREGDAFRTARRLDWGDPIRVGVDLA